MYIRVHLLEKKKRNFGQSNVEELSAQNVSMSLATQIVRNVNGKRKWWDWFEEAKSYIGEEERLAESSSETRLPPPFWFWFPFEPSVHLLGHTCLAPIIKVDAIKGILINLVS